MPKYQGCVNGFIWPIEQQEYVPKPKEFHGRVCVVCGTVLTGNQSKFCGVRCCDKYHKDRKRRR